MASRELRFGGIPRYVAKPDLTHEEMIQLASDDTNRAIQDLTGESMKDLVNPVSSNPQASGLIVHLLAGPDFQRVGKKFASEMVERQILVQFQGSEREAWTAFAGAVRDFKGFATLVGSRSEIWWHSALQTGGDYVLEELLNKSSKRGKYRKGEPQKATFPTSEARYSAKQKLTDIESLWDGLQPPAAPHGGLYYHFLKGNVPAIDSIWVIKGVHGQRIFDPEDVGKKSPPPAYVCATQMTIGSKESLSDAGMATFLNLADKVKGARVEFIFVTDPKLGKDKLHYVKVDARPNLRQWLLAIPADRIFKVDRREDV